MIELKLDVDTLFEWQKYSKAEADVPHYQHLLDFINLRTLASEALCAAPKKQTQPSRKPHSRVTSYATSSDVDNSCVVCKTKKHPPYIYTKFKAMSPEDKMQVVKVNCLCTNCLGGGHFKNQVHKCKVCQKPHHTLLHSEAQNKASPRFQDRATTQADTPVGSHAATRLKSDVLLMTCRVLITAPDGLTVEARALLDNASS